MVDECLMTGDYDEAVRFGQEALRIARTLGDRATEVVATTFLGETHTVRGEFSDAATFFERNVALEGDLRSERFGAPFIQSAVSGAWLADVRSQLGRFDEAIEHAEAAVRIAEAANHPLTLFPGLFYLGLAHLRRGDLPRATRVLERCLDLCRTWQFVDRTPDAAAALGPPTPSPAGLTRRARWWRAPSRSSTVARFTSGRRSFFYSRGGPPSRPGGSTRPPATPARRWRSPANSACARSSPTATSAWAPSISRRDGRSRPVPSCPLPWRCTVPWR